MSRQRDLIVGAIILGLVLAGGGYLTTTSNIIPKPSAGVQDVGDWGAVTDEHTEIITTFWTNNPYPIDLTTGKAMDIHYSLSLNGITIAEGNRERIDLPQGNRTHTQSSYLQNQELRSWWVNFLRANETARATAHGRVQITTPISNWTYRKSTTHVQFENQTPILDSMSQAAEQAEGRYVHTQRLNRGPFRQDVTIGAEVQDARATWGHVNRNQTTVLIHLRIHNPSETVPLIVEQTGLQIQTSINNVTLFHSDNGVLTPKTTTDQSLLRPGETREVVIPITMDNNKVDDWFQSHVQNGEHSTIDVRMQVVVDPLGIGKPIRIPQGDAITYQCSMQTAFFEDNQTAASTC